MLGAWVVGMALEVLGFVEGFWVDCCADIGVDAEDAETMDGDWSGLGTIGRNHARSELKVVHGVMVLGMWCEGLDSEYTVTSSTSYLNLQKLEVQKCGGFLELASACALWLPSIASRVFRTEVTNWVSKMFWIGGSISEWFQVWVQRWARWRCRIEEFGGMRKCEMHQKRLEPIHGKSQVEQESQVWVWYSECGNIHDTGNLNTRWN